MAERDINVDNSASLLYDQYLPSDFEVPAQQVITGTAITNINGLTGPNLTLGGGTSGFAFTPAGVTITLASPLTTKGDIYTHDSTAGIRLGVGSNGQVLTADSAQATGLAWVAAPPGILSVATKTADFTATNSSDFIKVDATGGNVIITLPAVASATKKPFYFKKIDASANTMTVSGDGNIDGAASFVTAVQYVVIAIIPDGTAWWIVN